MNMFSKFSYKFNDTYFVNVNSEAFTEQFSVQQQFHHFLFTTHFSVYKVVLKYLKDETIQTTNLNNRKFTFCMAYQIVFEKNVLWKFVLTISCIIFKSWNKINETVHASIILERALTTPAVHLVFTAIVGQCSIKLTLQPRPNRVVN